MTLPLPSDLHGRVEIDSEAEGVTDSQQVRAGAPGSTVDGHMWTLWDLSRRGGVDRCAQ